MGTDLVTSIQILVVSEDRAYKKSLKSYLNICFPKVDVVLIEDLIGSLRFLDEKPPFKLLIRKPTKGISIEEINNCMLVEQKDINLRVVVFQNNHKGLIKVLNNNSIKFLKKEKNLFSGMKTKSVLKLLEFGYSK